MKILHLTLGFYPAQAWGGPVKVVHQFGKELTLRGHNITVYCTNLLDKKHEIQGGTFERIVDGIRVVYFRTWRFPWWPGTLGPAWLPDLPSLLKREINNFDVVHINGYRNPLLLPVITKARKAGIPIITQPHGTLPIILHSFWAKRLYDHLLGELELRGVETLIALQASERLQAIKHGIPPERIVIIPLGIDTRQKESLPIQGNFRFRLGLDFQKPMILFLARINKKKGTDMLIAAFSKMKDKDAQLVIAGPDDGQLAEVKELIVDHGLTNRVWLPGLLTGVDVLSALQDADIFVLPCRTDTFPVAILEACLMSTPIVVTDRCEIAHLVKDKTASVVPFDSTSFAAAMDDLLTNHEKYEAYKRNSSELIAQKFSIEAVVDQLESVYKQVVEKANIKHDK